MIDLSYKYFALLKRNTWMILKPLNGFLNQIWSTVNFHDSIWILSDERDFEKTNLIA